MSESTPSPSGVRLQQVVLTRQQVAQWLKVNPRQVGRLGVPCIDLGRKTKRYLLHDVEAWLQRFRSR